jgi:alpha-N-arabinofuranosidase
MDFEGIDPSLFVDDDGRGWVVNNGAPPDAARYEGHRAIWLQQFDFASGKLTGPRTVLVDGGVHPEDKPIWAEGPHLYKVDGWYYLMAAEGGTAENHSETIYRSRNVEGPYQPGPVNPILTQRDLPKNRPDRVEATGHADLIHLDDGSWWGIFLATRPYKDQLTLLGRETWLLPVRWQDGWPLFLEPGQPVPFEAKRPVLPPSPGTDWSRWTERFDEPALSGEWLRMRGGGPSQWFALDRSGGGLELIAGGDPAGSKAYPSFLGRRLRHPSATVTAKLDFAPEHTGDFAGLMAFASEHSFLAVGIERGADGKNRVVARRRVSETDFAYGQPLGEGQVTTSSKVEVKLSLRNGSADLAWRTAGTRDWRVLARGVDVSALASVNSGLFTGVLVGPYAVTGGR